MEATSTRTSKGEFMPGIKYSPETMFQNGHVPQNKGKKFPGTGNVKSFAKGHQPHNTSVDGAVRIRTTKQGYTYQFIRIEKGKWEFMQKWRWTNEVGTIEKGMVLRCKTDDTLNCDPSNWELITMAENAARNCHNNVLNKTCTICGKEYKSTSKKSRTCSDECRREYNIQYMREWNQKHPREKKPRTNFVSREVRECQVCGNAYFPTSNVQKTCSDGCRTIFRAMWSKKYKSEHRPEKKALPEKHCSRCGQLFTPDNNSRTICDTCKTKKPRTVTCINCGTEFTSEGRGVQLLCSDECKRERKNLLRGKYGFKRKPLEPSPVNCKICGTPFVAKRGSKYCSDECRATAKANQDIKAREVLKLKKAKPIVMAPCANCGTMFAKTHGRLSCSDECRAELKRKNNLSHYQPRVKTDKTGKVQTVLNKKNPKPETIAIEAMPELNRNAPKNDREIIEIKNIVSPDLSKMEFRVFDPKLRITRFFRNEEKYLNYLKSIQ